MESDSQSFSEAAQRIFWEGIPAPGELPECWHPPECEATEILGAPEWSPLTACSQADQRLELNFAKEVAPPPLWGQALSGGAWTPPIQPPTSGTWVWQSGTRLHFWPDQPVLPATSYQVQGWAFATEAPPIPEPPGEQPSGPLRLLAAEKKVREEFRVDLTLEFTLRWSQPLDRSRFSPDQVQIRPTLKNLRVYCLDEIILVRGRGQAGDYEIDVSQNLRDIRGQLLGGVAFAQFQVERAPWFLFPSQPLQIMPRHHPPYFRCYALGFSQLLCRVMPVKVSDWERYLSTRDRPEGRIQSWQRHYWEFSLEPEQLDRFETYALDLSAYMEGGSGHLLLEVTVPAAESSGKLPLGRKNFRAPGYETSHTYGLIWLSYPELGLAAYHDPGRTQLLSLLAKTGRQHGLHRLTGAEPLLAELDSRQAFLPAGPEPGWDSTRLWAWLDRSKYRPGETLHAVGCWRRLDRPGGTLQRVGPARLSVQWRDSEMKRHNLPASALTETGHFSLALELPHHTPIGKHKMIFQLEDGTPECGLDFQVGEFSPPDLQVDITTQQHGPLWTFQAKVQDRCGRAWEGATVHWKLTSAPAAFRPPGWSEFHFGEELPQNRWSPEEAVPPDDRVHQHGALTALSPQGQAELQWLFRPHPEPPPPKRQPPLNRWGQGWRPRRAPQVAWRPALSGLRLRLQVKVCSTLPSLPAAHEATVRWEGLAQTADLCLGLRSQQWVYPPDEEPCVQVVVTDRLGHPLAGIPIQLQVEGQKKIWETTSRERPRQLFFEAPPGLFVVRAWVCDPNGQTSLTRVHAYRLGKKPQPSRNSQLACLLQGSDYEVGDRAQLWVQAPAAGTAVLRIGNGSCSTQEIRSIELGESCFEFLVSAAMLPQATVRLELFGNERSGRPRCWVAEEQLRPLPPPPLRLEIVPLRREDEVDVFVTVTDDDGTPIEGASVSLLGVDEAVLQAGLCAWTDPMDQFYPALPTRLGSRNSWDHYRQANLQELLAEAGEADMRGKCVTRSWPRHPQYHYPRWFAAPTVVAGCLTTNAHGVAAITFTVPQHPVPTVLLAAAVYGVDRCGSARHSLSLQSEWRLEARWPAFLRPGDECELVVAIHNYGQQSGLARIDLRGAGFLLHEPGGLQLEMPAQSSANLSFPLRTGAGPCLRLQVLLKAAAEQHLLEREIPVLPTDADWRWLLSEDLARHILTARHPAGADWDRWCLLLRRRKRSQHYVTLWGQQESEAVCQLIEQALQRADGQALEPLEPPAEQAGEPLELWLRVHLQARDDPSQVERVSANEWRVESGARLRVVVELLCLEGIPRLTLRVPLPAALEPLVGWPSTYPWNDSLRRPPHPGQRDPWLCVEVSPQALDACAVDLPPGRSQLLCECLASQSGRYWMAPALAEAPDQPGLPARTPGCWVEVIQSQA